MLLKRKEKENVVKVLYESSNVLASIYDNTTNELTLIFNSGTKYKYPNVSKTDYMRFELADSQGVVFNTHIKKYAFEKLESVDPKVIIAEINSLKSEEPIDVEAEITKTLAEIDAKFKELTELNQKLTEYFKQLKTK